ncbi:hypothetical protein DFO66_105133 [Brevibacterium sanguinis]|uniref:Uncharacterized protein n=2 Tax=Brevibacterium TaxID=1696 RepID=A0A366IIZ0_9MICO|nr:MULTISPECIES: hypothetical protein [Brevibacterium]RBP65027.1 hypothetical protein DFO66_105133 [Brevibacterium sanguinis]RBP71290.1 hypothetical protein DFO65_106133 [Brevibacterium celere]
MVSDAYQFPVAISRLSEGETSREPQNLGAIKWLLAQPGQSIVVVTPKKQFHGDSLKRLVALPGVLHLSWRGLSTGSFSGRRVLFAWPLRKHLNKLRDVEIEALVVIEWNGNETFEWIEDAKPVQLLRDKTFHPLTSPENDTPGVREPLPNGVEVILERVASRAAGCSRGLKRNEADKLKADMMNRPDRWASLTVEQVRAKCRALGMSADDTETIAGFLQRRTEGRRLNVRSSFRTFHFI